MFDFINLETPSEAEMIDCIHEVFYGGNPSRMSFALGTVAVNGMALEVKSEEPELTGEIDDADTTDLSVALSKIRQQGRATVENGSKLVLIYRVEMFFPSDRTIEPYEITALHGVFLTTSATSSLLCKARINLCMQGRMRAGRNAWF